MKIKFSNLAKLFLAGACFVAVGCNDYGQDIQNLNDRIDALELNTIDPLKVDLEAVKTDLAAAKTDLQGQVDANKGLIADLEDALAKANAAIQQNAGSIEGITQALSTALTDIEALKLADAGFTAQLSAIETALNNNISKVETLEKDHGDLKKAYDDHVKIYEAFVQTVEAKNGALVLEIEALKVKDTELESLAKAADELSKSNKTEIENVKAQLQLLIDADLITRVVALESFKTAQETINQELKDGYAALASQVATANADIATLKSDLAAQLIKVEANEKNIKDLQDAKTVLEGQIEAANKALETYKGEVTGLLDGLKAELDGKIKVNSDAIDALNTTVGNLSTEVATLKSDLAALQTKVQNLIDNEIKQLQGDLSALKGRLQSLVFVPQHKDGKATIEYAKFGTTIIEGQSTLLYQVHPAVCAPVLEQYKDGELQFLFTEELASTRAAAPALEVVDVALYDKDKGIIAVTAKAHNLHEVYAGKEFAVSLVYNSKVGEVENNIASPYTVLAAESEANADKITWALNTGYKTSAELEYIATESVKVLEGIDVVFSVNGTVTPTENVLAEYGICYKVKTTPETYNHATYTSALDSQIKDSKNVFGNTKFENGWDVKIALPKADKATVGLIQTSNYGFALHTCTNGVAGTTELDYIYDTATVEITKIKGYMTLDPQTITWKRSLDNDTDKVTPLPTKREVTTVAGKLLGVAGNELTTAGTTYTDIIAGSAAITVNGAPIAAPYKVVLGGTNEAPTVLFEGFEWDKEYTIVASYEIDNIIAEISIVLTTVQNESVVTLEPATITWNYAADKNSELGAATFRAVDVKADKADLYAGLFTNTEPLVGITHEYIDASTFPADSPIFQLVATGVKATGFEWNKDYAVKAAYALENEIVIVDVAVKTVKAPFVDVVVNLDAEKWTLNKTFVDESKYVDELNKGEIYSQLTNLGTISEADYLKDIFATTGSTAYTLDVHTVNGTAVAGATKFEIAADGSAITAVYNINDYVSTGVPQSVVYAIELTTWYGQKIAINKTLDINLKKVALQLAEETHDIAFELKIPTAAEDLAVLAAKDANLAAVLADDYKADVNAYLTAALVDKTGHLYKQNANTANGATYTESKLSIVDNGLKANAYYLFSEWSATPGVIDYVYNVTTWYGQEVEITKTVAINKAITVFDFVSEPLWVSPSVESTIVPEYTYPLDGISALAAFSLKSVKLWDAFHITKNGNEYVPTGDTLDKQYDNLKSYMDENHLYVEYEVLGNPYNKANLIDNSALVLNYDTIEDYVNVVGHMYLYTGISDEKIKLPTKFDTDYKNYKVNGHNPIEGPFVLNDVDPATGKKKTYVELVETKIYELNLWSLLQIVDKREKELFSNGAWVKGDNTNGFYTDGTNPCTPADSNIYGATMKFEIANKSDIPASADPKIKLYPSTGILQFDYTNKFELQKPLQINVKVTLTQTYGKTVDTTIPVTIVAK